MKTRGRLLGLLLACAVLIVGCSRGAEQGDEIVGAWKTLDGTQLALTDLRGKWVVVNYWATWCPPCRKEMPDLEAFYQQHLQSGKATVIGVNFEDADVSTIQKFATTLGIHFPIVLSNDLSGETPFGRVFGLPQTYILDPQGKVVFEKAGLVDTKLLNKVIQ